MIKKIALLLLFWLPSLTGAAQTSPEQFFKSIQLNIHNNSYNYSDHRIEHRGVDHLLFEYQEEHPFTEFRIAPSGKIEAFRLIPSPSFELVDSLLYVNQDFLRFRVRFHDLSSSDPPSLFMEVKLQGMEMPQLAELKLLPVSATNIAFEELSDELFIGEEKIIRLLSNRLPNLKLPTVWQTDQAIHYRFSSDQGQIYVHLLPQEVGDQSLELQVPTKHPQWDGLHHLNFYACTKKAFNVKPARTGFLNINKRDLILPDGGIGHQVEVELDYNHLLTTQKTYRIEASETVGSPLVAELFVRNLLNNGRVMCWLRLYDYHRLKEGYLYIKDGDDLKFITNFNILPQTKISQIHLRRESGQWEAGNQVFPGETVEIKLEGQSLNKARFDFEGLTDVKMDTLGATENMLRYEVTIPVGISKKQIEIHNKGVFTGKSLSVIEFSRPQTFNFVYLKWGNTKIELAQSDPLVFIDEHPKDISVVFDPNKIDQHELYGPQHLEIEVEIRDANNLLLDSKVIRNIVIKPEGSPRTNAYPELKYSIEPIHLNEHVRNKIIDLKGWSTVSITVRHPDPIYQGQGNSKRVDLVFREQTSFDIDVSFPAGLIIQRFGEKDFGNLGGISMAMISQFSFYRKDKVAKLKPYKIGIGFIALNAFNFSENNNNRDIGIVSLGSLYPIRTRGKLSFPLYTGGGYLVSEEKWFWLLGPGIRLQL